MENNFSAKIIIIFLGVGPVDLSIQVEKTPDYSILHYEAFLLRLPSYHRARILKLFWENLSLSKNLMGI